MTILVALWNNIHTLVFVVALVTGLAAIGLGVAWAMNADSARSPYPDKGDAAAAATCKALFKRAVITAGICAVLAAIPDVNDLWRARIARIKLELASPENVQKGTEEIARIARRLECKHLGCEEEKEKK